MTVEEYIKKYGDKKFESILTEKGQSYINKPNWIITDVRFPNEVKAIKDRGGRLIRVNRLDENGMPYKTLNNHPSETALDNHEFDITIDNNGSLEDLIEKIKQLNLV